MKKISAVLAMMAIVILAGNASAVTQTWSTTALNSMQHGTDYTWVVDNGTWFIPEGDEITSAYLSITNLNNWYEPENDWMNIYLLDNPFRNWPNKVLLTIYRDENAYFYYGWYWSGWALKYGKIWVNPGDDFRYDLTASQLGDLASFLEDGIFGLGFDPNCHYTNGGMSFTIHTTNIPQVPEPAIVLLFGLGLLGLAGVRSLKK